MTHPRGGELYRERHSVESPADPCDMRCGRVVELEPRVSGLSTLHEQAGGLRHRDGCERDVTGIGHGQRVEPHDVLAGDPQRLATGGEDDEVGACRQQSWYELGHCVGNMLAVVEDEQHAV